MTFRTKHRDRVWVEEMKMQKSRKILVPDYDLTESSRSLRKNVSYVLPAAVMTHVSLGIGLKSNGDGAELRVKEESGVEDQSGVL